MDLTLLRFSSKFTKAKQLNGLTVAITTTQGRVKMEITPKLIIKSVIGIIALTLAWINWPFAQVPAGSRGVVTTFGSPSKEVYSEGIHFVVPVMQRMNIVRVSIWKGEIEADAASKDLQSVTTKIAINYHVDPAKTVYVYTDLSNEPFDVIIVPAVQEAMKAVTAQYTAEQLISDRQTVRDAIIENLKSRLTRHGLIIDEFSVTDFQFSKSFNEAIEAKTTAEQLKLKADQDLRRIKVEAEQTVVQAQAQADALKAQKQEITPDLIELRKVENQASAIEKWNGEMPTYIGSGAVPFIEMPSTTK